MSINEKHEILTVPEVAERLRVGPKWVYSHVEFLGGRRMGKYIRFYWPTVLERVSAGRQFESQTLGSQPNDPSKDQ
jgi:hypothetical protein